MLTDDVFAALAKSDAVMKAACETSPDGLRQGLVPEFGTFSHTLKNAVVMMVDDEPTTIEVIQMFLEDLGFQNFLGCSDATRAIDVRSATRPGV